MLGPYLLHSCHIITSLGMACFVCDERPTNYMNPNSQISDCTRCGPSIISNWKNAQCVLEHMGTHIQHDGMLDRSKELCGLCLRPTPMCQFYLWKACGSARSVSVDCKKSNCANMIHFNYATASTSSEASPCLNVLIKCLLCPDGSPAVWTYNLDAHFQGCHRLQSPAQFPISISLSKSKKDRMQQVWNLRFKVSKPCKRKAKNKPVLAISEAHHMQLYLQ
jgi:hypothetical protein